MTTTAHLNDDQLRWLLQPVDPARVGKDGKGFAHLEAWDVRRFLIRLFGFGGYSTDLLAASLVHERETPLDPPNPKGKSKWTVVYRCAVRLTVRTGGQELGHWHGVATGAAVNLPSCADAHDLALKTADSQAVKRAATNLGDQFGLSLYNGGSLKPVILSTLAHQTGKALPEQDAPVQPDPEERPRTDDAAAAAPEPTPTQQPAPEPTAQPTPDPEREQAREEMLKAAAAVNFSDGIAAQFEAYFGHPISEGTKSEFHMARDLMRRGN
jgi:hypothetical protein